MSCITKTKHWVPEYLASNTCNMFVPSTWVHGALCSLACPRGMPSRTSDAVPSMYIRIYVLTCSRYAQHVQYVQSVQYVRHSMDSVYLMFIVCSMCTMYCMYSNAQGMYSMYACTTAQLCIVLGTLYLIPSTWYLVLKYLVRTSLFWLPTGSAQGLRTKFTARLNG